MIGERRGFHPRRLPGILPLAVCALALLLGAAPAAAQAPPAPCERCHGELELLRQQAGSLRRAEQLLVPHQLVAGSAHADMSCAECHGGYDRFPHEPRVTSTSSCESCHAPADSAWRNGAHAAADEPVGCTQCHTSHDIATAETLRTRHGATAANAPCRSCHESTRLEQHSVHADSVACAACHGPHAVRPADDPDSWMAPAHQQQTCGACHDSVAVVWRGDVHGDPLRLAAALAAPDTSQPVVCTSCHAGHRMLARDDPRFAVESVQACASCHEHARRTFFASYHGKATALGSQVSATCAECHGAHDILPDTMPSARVGATRLVETCKGCHPYARASFVRYDAHPDVFDRARNPWIFYSFWLMNGLLIFVLVVFGAHTLLWWLRILLDKRRAQAGAEGDA